MLVTSAMVVRLSKNLVHFDQEKKSNFNKILEGGLHFVIFWIT